MRGGTEGEAIDGGCVVHYILRGYFKGYRF